MTILNSSEVGSINSTENAVIRKDRYELDFQAEINAVIIANLALKGWFLPIGIAISVFNNINIFMVLIKSKVSWEMSKSVQIYYITIAIADILDCLFIHLVYFAGKKCHVPHL